MSKRLAAVAVLFLISLTAFSAQEKPAASKAVTWDLWGGVERMSGNVTYQIGDEGVYFPLSELKWPVDVTFGSVGGSARFGKWEACGVFSKNLENDAGTMEDSDWEDDRNPDLKTTYSESDTDFDGYTSDGSIRYWLMETPMTDLKGAVVSLGTGLGYLYQHFSWDAKNLDQWYPQNPEYGHDIVPGTVGSYESTLNMPYIEAAGKLAFKGLTMAGTLGFAPYAQVKDEDDHKLRYIRADTDADGTAFKASLQTRYNFADHLFIMAQVNYLSFDVDGTEKDNTYAGPFEGESWSIDHTIKSDQTSALLAAGIDF
jgi:outer membrane protease